MSKALAKTSYAITFFSDKEKSVRITEEQYASITAAINAVSFLEVHGTLYNVRDIKAIERLAETPKDYFMRIGERTFYTEQEYNRFMQGDL